MATSALVPATVANASRPPACTTATSSAGACSLEMATATAAEAARPMDPVAGRLYEITPESDAREFAGGVRVRVVRAGWFRPDAGGFFGVVPKPLWSRRFEADARGRTAEQLTEVHGEVETVSGVTVLPTGGHTRGSQAVLIGQAESMQAGSTQATSRAVFFGDLIPTRWQLPVRWTSAFDDYPVHA